VSDRQEGRAAGGKISFDVVVVGGGPAGSTAAYQLATSGSLDVLVVDKEAFPRHKTCGGALLGCRDWPAEFPNYAEIVDELDAHPVGDLVFRVDRSVWWQGRDTHFFDHVHRSEFDDLLLRAAVDKPGVSFRVFRVKSIERRDDGRIRLSDGSDYLEARAVIGADGVSGFVARELNPDHRAPHRAGLCLVNHITCDKPHDEAHIFYLWAGDLGYGYLFPTREGYYVGAGYAGPSRKRVKPHLDDLMTHCVANGLLPRDHRIHQVAGGLAPTTVVKNVATEGVLLVGDAAGLLNQLSGEGIYYAMKSGKMAGTILAESLDQADVRYRRAIQPLLDEVTYATSIRPRLMGAALKSYFGATRLAEWLGLDSHLKRPLVNRLFRRLELPTQSHYRPLR